jgi:hypothetical protein
MAARQTKTDDNASKQETTTTNIVDEMSLPRFPGPFLEILCALAPWRDVLHLVSVDRRETTSRALWLNQWSAVVELYVADKVAFDAFVAKYAHCVRRRTSIAFEASVFFFDRAGARVDDRELLADDAKRHEITQMLQEGRDGGGLKLADGTDVMNIRDDFEHVAHSFLVELPGLLRQGCAMTFQDHYDGEMVAVTIENDDMVAFYDTCNSDRLVAPRRAVMIALEDANDRLNLLRQT